MAVRTWIGTTSGDWGVTTNWVEGSVPVTGDAAYFKNNAVSVTAGLNQSAVTLASLTIDATYTGAIGTPSAYLQVGATALRIGDPSQSGTAGNGSGRIKIDLGSVQTTAVIVSTSTGTTDAGLQPVRLIGSHASNAITVLAGRVGIATTISSETATFAAVSLAGAGATVTLGSGVTLTTLRMANGVANVNGAFTTGYVDGGTLTVNGTGAVTTVYATAATVNLNSTGTITTLDVRAQATANLLNDFRARTVTTIKLGKDATLSYDPGIVTVTNPIQIIGATLDDVDIFTPSGLTVAVVKS